MPEGFGGDGLGSAERDVHVVAFGDDVVHTEGDDPAELLGIEENQASGDAIGERQIVIVQETIDQRQAAVVVHRRAVAPGAIRQAQARHELSPGRPLQEVVERTGRGSGMDRPGVDVALGHATEDHASLCEPTAEGDGGRQALLGVGSDGARTRGPGGSSAGPAQDPPGGIGAQDAAMADVGDGGQPCRHPGLELGQRFVPGLEGVVGHEQLAQEPRRPLARVGVERLVAEGQAARGDLGQRHAGVEILALDADHRHGFAPASSVRPPVRPPVTGGNTATSSLGPTLCSDFTYSWLTATRTAERSLSASA